MKEMKFNAIDIMNGRDEVEKNCDDNITFIFPISQDFDDKNNWAIVIGYTGGFTNNENDDDYYQICGKIAYQPKNSVMKDYGFDWTMPFDEELNEVYDTETTLDTIEDCEYLINLWTDVKDYMLNK